jgi:hypothetical protein
LEPGPEAVSRGWIVDTNQLAVELPSPDWGGNSVLLLVWHMNWHWIGAPVKARRPANRQPVTLVSLILLDGCKNLLLGRLLASEIWIIFELKY